MSDAALLIMSTGLTMAASFIVALYLLPRLRRVLTDICGTEDRTSF